MTEAKRGKTVAIAGTILQLAFSAGMLAMWLITGSLAAMACTWALVSGLLLWLMVAVLFYCRQLARQEETELAEISAHGEKRTIFEGEDGAAMSPAANRLETMERWVVPIFTVLWACGLAAVGLLTIRYVAALERYESLTGVQAAALFALLMAFVAFLFSRYCTGMGTERAWRLLRATGSYLLVNVLLMAGVLVGMLLASQKYVSADRVIAYVGPGVMLLLAAELVLNVVLDLYRPRVPGQEDRPPFDSRVFNLVAQPGRVGHTIAETLNYQFGFEVSKTWFYQLLGRAFGPLVVLGTLVMFIMSTIVIVPDGNEGILFRFGIPDPQTVKPGVSLKWPWPIDRVELYDTSKVYEIVLGEWEQRSEAERAASYINGRRVFLWTEEHGDREELDFLLAVPPRNMDISSPEGGKEDEQAPPSVDIIKLVVPVHYRIVNAFRYAYGARDSGALLKQVAYREMVRYCAIATLTAPVSQGRGKRPEAIMTHGRADAADKLKHRIQAEAIKLDLGVKIVYVGLVSVHPPKDVAPEYQKVLTAERAQDEKRYNAQGKANELLAGVAGTPADARKLALAIRVLDSLVELENSRTRPADWEKLVAGYVARVRENLADVDKTIRQEQTLGRSARAHLDYRKQLQEYLSVLEAVRKSPGTFDYPARIARARRTANERFDRATGQPAVLVAEARAYRWVVEMKERGRSEAFRWEYEAYKNNKEVYMVDRWLDVWDEVLPGIVKYVVAGDRENIEIRLNLEKSIDPMAGAMSGDGTGQ